MKLSKFPDAVRVQLTPEVDHELWHRVDEFGGVKALESAFDFPTSKMYNWKNHQDY